MKRPLLLLLFILIFANAKAQRTYYGVTCDYNSGLGQRYSYGMGINFEAHIRGLENVYFNWHYAIGSTTHSDMYARGPISVLLYKSEEWWEPGPHATIGSALMMVILPSMCPVGISVYTPRTHHTGLRYGFYCNPLEVDFWDQHPAPVTSWTIEGGLKLIAETQSGACLYFSIGASSTHNLTKSRQQPLDYGDENTLCISLGLLHAQY